MTKGIGDLCTQEVQFGRKVKSVAVRDEGVVAFILRTHIINSELVISGETDRLLAPFNKRGPNLDLTSPNGSPGL